MLAMGIILKLVVSVQAFHLPTSSTGILTNSCAITAKAVPQPTHDLPPSPQPCMTVAQLQWLGSPGLRLSVAGAPADAGVAAAAAGPGAAAAGVAPATLFLLLPGLGPVHMTQQQW